MVRIKLAIAEDNEVFRALLVGFLSFHFEVLYAVADGRSLVECVLLRNPDVIVSDVSMPIITGPQAMHELNTRGINIPFVFISAGENKLPEDAMFVSKGKIADDLLPAIQKSLSI
jgi:CheY-like chemotaxis protein